VAQARGFFTSDRIINGILPDAVDQGRIAGMAMAEDPGTRDYAGGVPLNTYSFFGQHAVSVGVHEDALEQSGVEVQKQTDGGQNGYLKSCSRTGASPESSASTPRSTRASCGN